MTVDFSLAGLEKEGFGGFLSGASLTATRCWEIPDGPGVYVVLRESPAEVRFLPVSTGGHFKGKDPSVPVVELSARWLQRTPVVYIGKADRLRRRVAQLLDFGAGSAVGHWGGRCLWQLEGSGQLLVGWQENPEPRLREQALLAAFERAYERLPFANLQR